MPVASCREAIRQRAGQQGRMRYAAVHRTAPLAAQARTSLHAPGCAWKSAQPPAGATGRPRRPTSLAAGAGEAVFSVCALHALKMWAPQKLAQQGNGSDNCSRAAAWLGSCMHCLPCMQQPHTRGVASRAPEATIEPSGDQATRITESAWPWNAATCTHHGLCFSGLQENSSNAPTVPDPAAANKSNNAAVEQCKPQVGRGRTCM